MAAAYKIAATDGFTRFTARNIANKMNCSTQPVYLEFKNMDDLRQVLPEQIYDHLQYEVFTVEHTGNTVIDLASNYIHFARGGKKLCRSPYSEEYGGGKEIQNFSYTYSVNTVKRGPTYVGLSEGQVESLYSETWTIATGIVALMSSSIIRPTDEQIEKMIQGSINAILKFKEPVEVD